MFHYFTIKFNFSFSLIFASLHLSNFCFEVKQSEAKFKSFFLLFLLFLLFFTFFAFFAFFRFILLFSLYIAIFSCFSFFSFFLLNFCFASIFSFNFRLFYLRFRFRFLVFRIEVNHVKSGFFFGFQVKRNFRFNCKFRF